MEFNGIFLVLGDKCADPQRKVELSLGSPVGLSKCQKSSLVYVGWFLALIWYTTRAKCCVYACIERYCHNAELMLSQYCVIILIVSIQ